MKKYILLIACALGLGSAHAQSLPKWAEKAKKSVFSVITYNEENKILNTGNGFYIDERGTAISDFTLFKDAHHAVVVTADGKELPVLLILGANDMYDVIKFRTDVKKKSPALVAASQAPKKDETVYVLPYSTQKETTGRTGSISNVDSIANNSFYYTMNLKTGDKIVSCPVMNNNGEVIGLIQKNSDSESEQSYALGIGFAKALNINALSGNDTSLKAIKIKKGLPDDESQALVMLYMMSSQVDSDEYFTLLNDFISQYPKSAEGYLRRATFFMSKDDEPSVELAEKDLEQMFKVTEKEDESHYQLAKLIYNYNIGLQGKQPKKEWTLDRALTEIKKALEISKEGLYYQTLGDICYAQSNYTEAIKAFEEVNKTSLASAASFYAVATAKSMIEGTDKKELVALLDSAVARFLPPYGTDAAPYLYERGRYKSEVKDYRGAVKDFNSFYDAMIGQVTAEFYAIRSEAEQLAHMNLQAIEDINKAIEMEPENASFWNQKGGLHIRFNQMEEAVKALEKAIALNPNDAGTYRMLGFSQIKLKNKKEGLANLQKAKELGDTVASQLIEKYK